MRYGPCIQTWVRLAYTLVEETDWKVIKLNMPSALIMVSEDAMRVLEVSDSFILK